MLTEDEAKQKWCPHVRLLEPYAEKVAMNRGSEAEPVGACIGSECMAWRWLDGPAKRDVVDAALKKGERFSERYTKQCRGYCGLAGSPS